jgi:hypothetical protein
MEIKPDPEFKSHIPPLTPEEYAGLERSLKEDGCRDAIITWNNLILDGHNRYEICLREDIKFKTFDKCFEDRNDALDWIDANQLSRRNLTPEQISLIRGRMYNRAKGTLGGQIPGSRVDQNDPPIPTADRLAKENNVSAPTIKRDVQFASAVEELKPIIPDIEKQVMSGEIPSKQSVIKAAKDPKNAALHLAKKSKDSKKTNKKEKVVKKGNGEVKDSNVLVTLKRYWKKATPKDKKVFLEWIKES